MRFSKPAIALLALASAAAASPVDKRQNQVDPTAITDVLSGIVTSISDLITSITGIVSIAGSTTAPTAPTTTAATTTAAFVNQVKSLKKAFKQGATQLNDLTPIPDDVPVNDPAVTNLTQTFASFVADAITNLSTIAQSPTTDPEQASSLLDNALPGLNSTIQAFVKIVPQATATIGADANVGVTADTDASAPAPAPAAGAAAVTGPGAAAAPAPAPAPAAGGLGGLTSLVGGILGSLGGLTSIVGLGSPAATGPTTAAASPGGLGSLTSILGILGIL